MVSSLSPDFCRTVGPFFCGFQTFLNSTSTFLMRDLPGEQMELRFLDLIVTVDTIYFFNKLNQRISRNSLEILKVFVLFSPCEHFFFFSRWKTYSQCVFGPALEKDSKRLFDLTNMEESHFWFSGAVENPSKMFFCVGEMLVNMKGVKLSRGRSFVHLLLGIKWCHKNCVEIAFCLWERVSLWCSTFIFKETSGTWQFFVAFFWMFKCSFKGSCDLQLGNQKVILNHRISFNCRSLFFFQSQHACPAFL